MPAQPEPTDRAEVRKLAAAVDEVLAEEMRTSHRDDQPDVPSWADGPRIGTAPPVAQPGAPAMSQRATDISRMMIAAGVATVPPGLIAIGVLLASEQADPTVIAMICAAPAAIAVPVFALARLLRRVKEAVPDVHHYYGDVHQDQRNITTKTTGVWAKTRNEPR